jgi:hypothetical protein
MLPKASFPRRKAAVLTLTRAEHGLGGPDSLLLVARLSSARDQRLKFVVKLCSPYLVSGQRGSVELLLVLSLGLQLQLLLGCDALVQLGNLVEDRHDPTVESLKRVTGLRSHALVLADSKSSGAWPTAARLRRLPKPRRRSRVSQ